MTDFGRTAFGGYWGDTGAGRQTMSGSAWDSAQMPGAGAPIPGVSSTASSIAQQSAAAADPFASQREQYQQPLAQLMNGPAQGQVGTDIQSMRTAAQQPIGGPYMDMLQKLMTDKNSITITPGSQFAQEQGQQALERSQAAKGFLGSGNIMSELQKQGQGIAAQDYTQQLADIRAAAGLSQGIQGQQFGQQQQIAQASGGALQDQYARLAQLSGANTGSPGTAGSLLAKQFDWANQGGGGSAAAGGFSGAASSGAYNERNDPLGSMGYNTTGAAAPYFGYRFNANPNGTVGTSNAGPAPKIASVSRSTSTAANPGSIASRQNPLLQYL